MPLELSPLPRIGVLATKHIPGANNLADEAQPLRVMGLDEALSTPWRSDAHFTAYAPVNTGQAIWPRLNKPILPKLRLQGADILTQLLVLDYDRPQHVPWTRPEWEQWLRDFDALTQRWVTASPWAVVYSTRGGARIIYILDESVPVDVGEQHHQWLCQQFCEQGLSVDLAVSDWTRIFRLPFVVRDNVPTWEAEGVCEYIPRFGQRLDVEWLGKADRQHASEYGIIKQFDEPKPDTDYALQLLRVAGSVGPSEFLKDARRRLRGRECFDCIFKHLPLAPKGHRDTTIHAYVGQAMSLLWSWPGLTPTHLYAMFLDPVQQLEPDAGTPSWTDVLWRHIGSLWAKEAAKAQLKEEIVEQQAENALTIYQTIIQGMQKWCDSPALDKSENEAMAWVSRRLIASVGQNYLVMRQDGMYDPMLLQPSQVVSRIRTLGMDGLIQTQRQTKQGGVTDLALSEIVGAYSTAIHEIRAAPCLKGAHIENMDRHDAVLVMPTFDRNDDLEPEFDQDVDDWLQVFFGPHYQQGVRWIAWALAFDQGPICALSIEGDPGIGKKMLIKGLAETLRVPATASAMDLVSDYQYGLLRSPFLCINEGWPKATGGRHPADEFRALVGGDPIYVQRKYMAPVSTSNPARVIFTANNMDVIQQLTGNRNLSPQDREALAIRLLHFKLDGKAAEWLSQHGGLHFTGQYPRRWVANDATGRSDFIVAKHFMWLYKNRGPAPRGRFLVQGNSSNEIMWEMRTQSGSAPVVIEVIISMLESKVKKDGLHVTEDGRLFVLTSEIVQFFRLQMQNNMREKLTTGIVNQVIRGLVRAEVVSAREIKGRESMGRRHWHEIDVELLQGVARRDGWNCPTLDEIVEKQRRSLGLDARDSGAIYSNGHKDARVVQPLVLNGVDQEKLAKLL